MFFRKAKRIKELERDNELLRTQLMIAKHNNKLLKEQILDITKIRVCNKYPYYVPIEVRKKDIREALLRQLEEYISIEPTFPDRVNTDEIFGHFEYVAELEIVRRS